MKNTSTKKNIFICIPCLMLGGSEIATLQMVDALQKGGYNTSVVCYYEFDPQMLQRYQASGANVILLKEVRNGFSGLLHLFSRLYKLFRARHPDIIHVQYFAPGMIPILAARAAGVHKIFATVHAAGQNGYQWKARFLFRISASLTSHFFCVAENTERFWFGTVGGKRHSTIHNGIDVDIWKKAKPAVIPGILPGDVVVGIVGRIVKLKGHDCLFRAAARLLKEYPRLKILVVGDGPDRQFFETLNRQMNLQNHTIWTGRIEPEKLPGYYQAMDVLAMPSHWEGFGLTAAEGMAAGVPVAASNVPGLREVVGDAGELFPVNDDERLAISIQKLLAEKKRFSQLAADRIAQRFALKKQQRKWLEAYLEG